MAALASQCRRAFDQPQAWTSPSTTLPLPRQPSLPPRPVPAGKARHHRQGRRRCRRAPSMAQQWAVKHTRQRRRCGAERRWLMLPFFLRGLRLQQPRKRRWQRLRSLCRGALGLRVSCRAPRFPRMHTSRAHDAPRWAVRHPAQPPQLLPSMLLAPRSLQPRCQSRHHHSGKSKGWPPTKPHPRIHGSHRSPRAPPLPPPPPSQRAVMTPIDRVPGRCRPRQASPGHRAPRGRPPGRRPQRGPPSACEAAPLNPRQT
mmetsp:Transcript_63027/g.159556  ORF Transcript_63027/g.159556 Transcript_63027/m.159556 type:complete len:257 (-) Transcript_63027:557-1327(-)